MTPQQPMDPQDAEPLPEGEEGVAVPVQQEEPAHEGHYLPPPTLWEKITGWRGSFLVLSILFHVILIAVAAFLVVQVVKGREKLKFTAPPPTSAPKSQEHKVQMAKKKNSMSAPSMSKRITTTSTKANIALPAVQMSSSSSPDLMSSVMSGMGGAGLGAGFGASGGGSAMPAGGLTAFGFKKGGKGLEGTFYDLKPQAINNNANYPGKPDIIGEVASFLSGNKDAFKKNFSPNVKMRSVRIFIPLLDPKEALNPDNFDVLKSGVKQNTRWIIHYTGKVRAPINGGKFRFRGRGDNLLLVRITRDGEQPKNVFFDSAGVFFITTDQGRLKKYFTPLYDEELIKKGQLRNGKSSDRYNVANKSDEEKKIPAKGTSIGPWFDVKPGEVFQIDILASEGFGSDFEAYLLIEEEGKTYTPAGSYPVFEMAADLPPVKVEKGAPLVSKEKVIFQAQ